MILSAGGAALILLFAYLFELPLVIIVVATILLILFLYISLAQSLRKLSRILESQKLFVSNVAHELRGPMAVMQMEAEAALYNISLPELTDKKSSDLIAAIRTDLDGLRQMSNILKNLSLMVVSEYSPEQPQFKKIDLSALLERICAHAEKEYALEKSINIKVEAKTPAFVFGNESALEQIILNLLQNAVRYSPEKTTIIASATREEGSGTTLAIRDHGYGISKQDLPHVLNPFYRADHGLPMTEREVGSGLGLAIVASLAKQHRADVSIASALEKGTTVTLNFPLIPQGI